MKMNMEMKMKMNQALSLRTAATTAPGTLNTLLRAGLGSALLALATACSGDMDAGYDGLEEFEDEGSELVDESDPVDATELDGAIEKATFNDNFVYNGFNVGCTATQKARINEAQARALQILSIAGPASANARVNRTTAKALLFRSTFVPNGNTNPDPNRPLPDAWDTATFRVGQKTAKISQFLNSALHTCHGGNESVIFRNGAFQTCNQSLANAVTDGTLGGTNEIRWCDVGLSASVGDRAVTLLHEMTHHDKTNDATGGHVFDDNRNGPLYNAHNYGRWFNNNQP